MGPASASSCSVCGEPLGAKGVCFACLLRAGLDDAEQPVPPEPAALFDDFEIARSEDGSLWELGRGGMGVTYRAIEKTLHRNVALKVIELHGSEAVRERFLREARAAAALRHPNVAGVFRFGALPGGDRCYCAMELVEGETLVETALGRLAAAYKADGKENLFENFQTFLAVGADPLPAYSELATRLAVAESTIRSHVTRLRARYREMLRAEVRPTVNTEAEVDAELRELLRVLIGN